MILVPGWMWRRGPASRAVGAGLAAGVFFGAFAVVEAKSWAGAVVVFVVLSLFYGTRVARRMGRIWPAAEGMNRTDRAAVVRATRRGEAIDDPRLAPAVAEYADALRRTAEEDRLHRWIVLLVTALAVALAVYDTVMSSTGETIASWLMVALFLADLMWWPRGRARLLARADRAEASARTRLG
ncbi:hypothetical protein BFF78_27985 [Streptomyces fodineus]|uniref:Uncharacterized protein n=1 Tax=Streptomyces fodineus TaxID=1904616 RepID=A0A1D7YP48_9ACTN|nr:hypothetical protein [Streptomyces fodineus]AOR37367.1 hypothetical protein BFF78_27985 [Streptomyces fodineus]